RAQAPLAGVAARAPGPAAREPLGPKRRVDERVREHHRVTVAAVVGPADLLATDRHDVGRLLGQVLDRHVLELVGPLRAHPAVLPHATVPPDDRGALAGIVPGPGDVEARSCPSTSPSSTSPPSPPGRPPPRRWRTPSTSP